MDGITLTSTSLEDTSLCYASSSAPAMCGTIVAVDSAPAAEAGPAAEAVAAAKGAATDCCMIVAEAAPDTESDTVVAAAATVEAVAAPAIQEYGSCSVLIEESVPAKIATTAAWSGGAAARPSTFAC